MKDVDDIHKSGVPEKTQKQICWATKVWSDWARQRMMLPFVDEEKGRYELTGDFCAMSNDALNFWLRKIVPSQQKLLSTRFTLWDMYWYST